MTFLSTPRRAARTACLICAGWLSLTLNVSAAEPARKDFDIPSGLAPATLKQFIAQSNVQLMYVADEVQGVNTRSVNGRYTAMEAIQVLLADTGLVGKE